MQLPLPDDSAHCLFTDPPYYDAVPYADLSDFFYVWLRRMLKDFYPALFAETKTPKRDEVVQLAERNPTLTMGHELAIPSRIRAKLAAKLRESAGNCWPVEET